jgi:acetylornithine/succinyldiaminopimelate/putrescine aminotransferase
MPFDVKKIVQERLGENYTLHERYLNSTLVSVQRIIGFDQVYARAEGAYLYDREGKDYLDFLSGYSVFNLGRNHPAIKQAIRDVLDLDLPNMVQMDCSLLSGLLAEALIKRTPAHLEAVFFCNSGAESVEGAIKFARAATGRAGLVSFEGAFHGLTHGALSVMGNKHFQEGFGPLLQGAQRVRLGDLAALEEILAKRETAALIFEPVQGKGLHFPADGFYNEAQRLCRKYGTLLIADEIQTGLGRTGTMWGHEHWGLEPDIMTVAKSLSGGFVPIGAIITRRAIYQKTFSRLDRCVVHSSTFGRNNLAMVCGLATLQAMEEENIVARAKETGAKLIERLRELMPKHSLIKEIRGLGLMIGIEFHEPRELTLKMGWKILHKLEQELFGQMIVTALFKNHRILAQVAGHGMDVVKIIPPLIIGEKEIDRFVNALDAVLNECRKFPGPLWDLGQGFVRSMMKTGSPEKAAPAATT